MFYIIYANAMIWQGWERSPTAQNANSANKNLDSTFCICCTVHDSTEQLLSVE